MFRISPNGTYTNLYSFDYSHGDQPEGALVQGSDGNFYGVAAFGGTSTNCFGGGCGALFRISASGSYTTLYSFVGSPSDGGFPDAGLVQASDANFYGTTSSGGIQGWRNSVQDFCSSQPSAVSNQSTYHCQFATPNIIFTIPSIAGETYQLQFSSSMTPTNWSNVPGVSVTNSIGSLLTLTNFGGAVGPQGFYRFDITP